MKTLKYNPMDKSTHGYDMLDEVNVLIVYGHPYSNSCEDCWRFYKIPDKSECDANGIPLARGIFGNMLIQMQIGKVQYIYGANCGDKTLADISKSFSDNTPVFNKVLEEVYIFRIVR